MRYYYKRTPFFSKKRKRAFISKIKLRRRWILGIGLTLIFSFFFTGNKSLFTLYTVYKERNVLSNKKLKLELENKRLLKEINKLKKDIGYIERVAREKYNLKKIDEEIYKIVPQ